MESNNACALILSGPYALFVVLQSGDLTLPGGKVEGGESSWRAMSREFKEETGIHRPNPDQADLSNKYKRHHRNGTTTKIYYGQTKRHYTWYTFNRHGVLSPGETKGLVWIRVHDAVHNPRVKSYCRHSLEAMAKHGCL
jgi:8-oxo-dGTP pyrophosphatase MutT (NUDIX family)